MVCARGFCQPGPGCQQLGVRRPLGSEASKQLVASARLDRLHPFRTDAGATLPLLNGPWTFTWLADGSPDLVSANVTLAC